MKQLTKQEYQKKSLAISTLALLLESSGQPIAQTISVLFSPIGEKTHPYKWTDNETLGILEKELEKLSTGDWEDEE